jgi:PAS domain-containing protein
MRLERKVAEDRTWRLVIVGLLLTALAWTLNAWIDARFDAALFLHEVFHPEPKHLLIRIVFVLTQIAFLVYIAVLFKRRRGLEKELLIALRQKEEEHRKNEAVLESLGDPISIQDRELRVIYQNVAHRELMGSHRGELCYSAYQKREGIGR